MRATSAAVAPPGPKPVEVLTKSAPAALAMTQAFTFSSSVEERGLDDDLHDGAAGMAGLHHRGHVALHEAVVART